MTKRERLEDLGEIKCKLAEIISMPLFEHTLSKHDYEIWLKEVTYSDDEDEKLYELHCSLRGLKSLLMDVYSIACGDSE